MYGWNLVYANATKALWDPLYRFGVSLSHNTHDAEDLVQVSLLKGLQGFQGFIESRFPGIQSEDEALRLFQKSENLQHLKNWLFKILKNTFLDTIEKNKRTTSTESLDHHEAPQVTTYQESEFSGHLPVSQEDLLKFENSFYALALDDTWKLKLQDLTARQRSVLFLCAEGYSYKEAAEILDIPVGTVMSNLSRSLGKLRRQKKGTFGE